MQTFALSLPAGKARVIYDAIQAPARDMIEENQSVRRELGIPQTCSLIGMVARVSAQKDYFTLASAAAEVLSRYPDTRFLIVGDNSLVDLNRLHYQEVRQRLGELGIADKFIFTGHQSDVPRFIAAMDICVLCTHREGFPLSILECMAMRRAVVATAAGGIPEIVKSGVNGYLHQHGNSKELADIFVSLIENPEKTRQMGLSACEHVRQHYALARYVDEMSAAYNDVMR